MENQKTCICANTNTPLKPKLTVTVDEKPVPKLPNELDESAAGLAKPRPAIFAENVSFNQPRERHEK